MKNNKFFSRVFDDALSPIAWLGYLKEHNLSEEDEKKINDLYTVDLENDGSVVINKENNIGMSYSLPCGIVFICDRKYCYRCTKNYCKR